MIGTSSRYDSSPKRPDNLHLIGFIPIGAISCETGASFASAYSCAKTCGAKTIDAMAKCLIRSKSSKSAEPKRYSICRRPHGRQKSDKRNRVVREILSVSPLPFFYVNQVGAQNNGKNILVFDGDSTAYTSQGEATHRARAWTDGILYSTDRTVPPQPQSQTDAIFNGIITGLRHLDHIRGAKNKVLVAASGGIDSSVVLCLLEQAFGPERICAVNMPTRYNAQITQDNAHDLCRALKLDYLSCPIGDLYRAVSEKIQAVEFPHHEGAYTRLVDENIQARIRFADVLSGIAAKHGMLFTNNGNKTEVALGYATLYGDVSGAVAPIADLYGPSI